MHYVGSVYKGSVGDQQEASAMSLSCSSKSVTILTCYTPNEIWALQLTMD